MTCLAWEIIHWRSVLPVERMWRLFSSVVIHSIPKVHCTVIHLYVRTVRIAFTLWLNLWHQWLTGSGLQRTVDIYLPWLIMTKDYQKTNHRTQGRISGSLLVISNWILEEIPLNWLIETLIFTCAWFWDLLSLKQSNACCLNTCLLMTCVLLTILGWRFQRIVIFAAAWWSEPNLDC